MECIEQIERSRLTVSVGSQEKRNFSRSCRGESRDSTKGEEQTSELGSFHMDFSGGFRSSYLIGFIASLDVCEFVLKFATKTPDLIELLRPSLWNFAAGMDNSKECS